MRNLRLVLRAHRVVQSVYIKLRYAYVCIVTRGFLIEMSASFGNVLAHPLA